MKRKMKRIILITTLSLGGLGLIFGQNFQDGGYANLDEFKNNTPKYADVFEVIKRTEGDILAWGGNDYKVKSTDKTIKNKAIKREIWGIVKNDTLFLNGYYLTELNWYVKVEIFGKYCFLKPALPVNRKIVKALELDQQPNYGMMFGAVGGAIQGAQLAVARIPLIYNLQNGESKLLNKKNIFELLQNFPDLKNEFEQETNRTDESILLKYLIKLNEKDSNWRN